MQSEQINELAAALSKAQGEFTPVKKDSKAHYSKYADLPTILETVRPTMAKFELAITFNIGADDILTVRLLHSSGQWMSSCTHLRAKSDLHTDIGSAVTYMRRYLVTAILGIAPYDEADDDGVRNSTPKFIHLDRAKTLNDKFLGYPQELKKTILDSFKINNFSELTETNYTAAVERTKKVLTEYNR